MKIRIFILLLLFGLSKANFAQGLNGKVFWFGVLENLFSPTKIEVMVVSNQAGTIKISAPAQGFASNYNIVKGSNFITLNKSVAYPSAGPETIDDKGLLLESSFDVSVFVINEDNFSSDASPIIPFSNILKGDKYIVQSLRGSVLDGSSFLVVSTADNSEFTITPSAETLSGFSANLPFNVTLDKGETFLVKANNEDDLSGSTIVSKNGCAKFAVFAGSRCSPSDVNTSACSGCDHLFSQLMPVSQFGDTFYIAPFFNQAGNYLLKVTAAYDNTAIYFDNVLVSTLAANQSYEYRPIAPAFKKTCVYTSKPVQVFKYMNSNGCNLEPNGNGDPSMLMIPSKEKWVNNAHFGLFNSAGVSDHYINIVANTRVLRNLIINSNQNFTFSIDSTLMCDGIAYGTIRTVQSDIALLSNVGNFYSYVYSIGKNESFAYLTGANFFPFQGNFSIDPVQTCFNAQPVNLSIDSDSLQVSSWDMKDGNIYRNVSAINHSYLNNGKYNAELRYKKKGSFCDEDTIIIPITIFPNVEFTGIRNDIICPGEKLTYTLRSNQKLTYDWGSGIVGARRELSQVGKYIIIAKDSNGCIKSDSFILSDSGCFDKNLSNFNIFTPNNDGLNDFYIPESKGYDQLNIEVFDRWGRSVFVGDVIKNEFWDGNIGKTKTPATEGTYYYKLIGRIQRTGNIETYYGVITLIR